MLDAALSDLIRRGYEAFFAGDLDAASAYMAEDVVGIDADEMPDAGEHHGREAVQARLAGFRELFEALELRGLEIAELGDRVLVVIHIRGRATSSDVPVDFQLAYLLAFRDGLATEIRSFLSEDQARAYAQDH